jgi:hypothetical protein
MKIDSFSSHIAITFIIGFGFEDVWQKDMVISDQQLFWFFSFPF